MSKILHDVKKLVMTTKYVKQFVMTLRLRHDVKTEFRHDIKNTSWRQKVYHDYKIRHDVKQFVVMLKLR